jgi:hypothetical protein
VDNHSSGTTVTSSLKRPTRIPYGPYDKPEGYWIPIWSCSKWGLPCQPCYQCCGALLPHLFTLTSMRRFIFCGTFRRFTPPRRYLALYPMEPGLSSLCITKSDCLTDFGTDYIPLTLLNAIFLSLLTQSVYYIVPS